MVCSLAMCCHTIHVCMLQGPEPQPSLTRRWKGAGMGVELSVKADSRLACPCSG